MRDLSQAFGVVMIMAAALAAILLIGSAITLATVP